LFGGALSKGSNVELNLIVGIFGKLILVLLLLLLLLKLFKLLLLGLQLLQFLVVVIIIRTNPKPSSPSLLLPPLPIFGQQGRSTGSGGTSRGFFELSAVVAVFVEEVEEHAG
jgi:hypothetical protein